MRRPPIHLHLGLPFLFLAVCLAGAAHGQGRGEERYPFRFSAFYGLGGPIDDPGAGAFDQESYQLGFSWITDWDVLVGVRYGELDFGEDEGVGGRSGSDLTYATIGGEYLFDEGYYTSGVYLGVGWYDLGEDPIAEIPSDSAIGLALGLTGDFRVTRRLSILIELSGHYTDLDDADLLAMGHAGLAFRF